MKRITNLMISIILLVSSCTHNDEPGIKIIFPKISEPIQITNNGREHLFASYYGINSFSKSEKYVTVLQTDVKYGVIKTLKITKRLKKDIVTPIMKKLRSLRERVTKWLIWEDCNQYTIKIFL